MGETAFQPGRPEAFRTSNGTPEFDIEFRAMPTFWGAAQIRCANRRKRGALPHIGRHSQIPLAELLRQSQLVQLINSSNVL